MFISLLFSLTSISCSFQLYFTSHEGRAEIKGLTSSKNGIRFLVFFFFFFALFGKNFQVKKI